MRRDDRPIHNGRADFVRKVRDGQRHFEKPLASEKYPAVVQASMRRALLLTLHFRRAYFRGRLSVRAEMPDAIPATFATVEDLDAFMSSPSDTRIADLEQAPGDIVVIGVGGKMGPTLARM